MARHNVYLSDDAWALLQQQAAREGARLGRTVSVSEWVRILAERERKRQAKRTASRA